MYVYMYKHYELRVRDTSVRALPSTQDCVEVNDLSQRPLWLCFFCCSTGPNRIGFDTLLFLVHKIDDTLISVCK